MGEIKALSWNEQLELFKSRGMIVNDSDIEKIQNISYYRLKEFARPLAKIKKSNGKSEIRYNGIEFKEVLTRYYQDKNLRLHILHAIEKIEVSIKTRISYVLGSNYGAFGYLNFSSWSNRKKYSKFTIEKVQFDIKNRLVKITKKSQSSEVRNRNNLDQDGFPSVWLGIDLLMFGDIVKILEIMSESNLKSISSHYCCTNDELISWMKCLNFVRNACAHNSNLIDIKLTTKPKFRKSWSNFLYFMKSDKGKKPTNRLSIIIVILIELVKQINPKYKWQDIQNSIRNLCKENEERAHLLGFNSVISANNIVS
ncbi:Abi family protein, partial [Enterococcus cecorum]